MEDKDVKIIALYKILDEEFSPKEIKGLLINLLLYIHQDDDIKAVEYLSKVKDRINIK